ncbi:hypothetical protein [Luteolibacter luteus]|uniref:Uncharacterized protein n=1 Tax=Luteolibacter luteus TaxID=2728835 RepID=A0A858RHA3_9BACT|nr:hypothetical protein [Luteolibacter luteus]QJE96192.1 hypothetical protein HHL09_10475 [Luteolibacter luteus]
MSRSRDRIEAPTRGEMLEEMARLSMTAEDRAWLKRSLLDDWRSEDPLGFLEALDDQPWPGRDHHMDELFAELARRDPESLIRYARRTGNSDAWNQLAESGDPRQIMALLLNDPAVPKRVMGHVVSTAMAKDPDFYRGLTFLSNSVHWKDAFAGAASALLSRERVSEYSAWLHDLGESVPAKEAGEAFASLHDDYPGRTEKIADLPDAVRLPAAQFMVAGLRENASDSEMMKVLETLNREDWWGWKEGDSEWEAALERAIGTDFLGMRPIIGRDLVLTVEMQVAGDPDGQPKMSWAEWALRFPDEGAGRLLRDLGARRWVFDLGNNWESEIPKLPDAALRDTAYAEQALFTMDGGENEDAWGAILDKIEDESFRESARARIEGERKRWAKEE